MISETTTPSVSIIIPTHNRCAYITETLKSFANQDYPMDKYEIIVINNNSSDNTSAVVNGFIKNSKAAITYIFEPRTGNHYARNRAALMAKGDILYFCDDDVIADSKLLKEIIKPFIIDKYVGTATGRVLPKWETPPPKWIERYCNNRFLSLLDPPEDFLISDNINYLFSCHQAVKKNVFIDAGGFNPESFGSKYLGDGETGLNIKIRKLGYKFAFNGASITYHVMSPARYTQKYLNKRLGNAGYAQAYTDFKKTKSESLRKFCSMASKTTFVYMPSVYLANLLNFIKYKDPNVARFFIAQGYYYKNYLKYLSWLYSNKNWRAFAKKTDWIQNDSGFEEEIKKYTQ